MKVITSEEQLITSFLKLLEQEGQLRLVFQGQRHTKEIGISNGEMTYATSNLLKDKLSEILFKSGKLSQDQYLLATELSILTQKRTGEILIFEGYLTKKEVITGLRTQAKQIMSSLFEHPEWQMEIKEYHPDDSYEITPRLLFLDAVMAGIRSVDNLSILYEALPQKEEVLEISSNGQHLMEKIHLTEQESIIFHMIDGKKTFKEILKESRMLEFSFYKTLYPLAALQLIQTKKNKEGYVIQKVAAAVSSEKIGSEEIAVPESPSQYKALPNPQALFEEAQLLLSTENYSAAANKLRKLILFDNKKSAYYYYLGLALDHIPSQNKEAEKVLKMAIKLENYNPRYYLALGYLYLNRNKKQRAREQFMAAYRWDASDPYVLEALEKLDELERKGAGFLQKNFFRKKKIAPS